MGVVPVQTIYNNTNIPADILPVEETPEPKLSEPNLEPVTDITIENPAQQITSLAGNTQEISPAKPQEKIVNSIAENPKESKDAVGETPGEQTVITDDTVTTISDQNEEDFIKRIKTAHGSN